MRYVSKLIEVEAEQWPADPGAHFHDAADCARGIVAWVNANGGEARYEPMIEAWAGANPSRIAICTINGWAYAAPGHYVVQGTAWFNPTECGRPACSEHRVTAVRDFYPCDPETFVQHWEPDSSSETTADHQFVTTWYRCRLHPTNVQATTGDITPEPCHRYDEIKDAPCFLPMEKYVPSGPVSTE